MLDHLIKNYTSGNEGNGELVCRQARTENLSADRQERKTCLLTSKIGNSLKSHVHLFLLFALLIPNLSIAQVKDNLFIFYSLIDSSVNRVVNSLPLDSREIFIKTNLQNNYSVFAGSILTGFKNSDRIISLEDDKQKTSVQYTIDNAKVTYPEIFRESFLGSFMVVRKISLNGNYFIGKSGVLQKSESFSFTSIDSVDYDSFGNIESQNIPFTQGEKPGEPFFSSLWEPVVAIGAAAAIIYLFFSIRSK
ncbi:MAG: hypothetical protein NTX22_15065 [Ignavibacteriales bacterium]|nr:hypothetical protein [Ignavibacteriales bacterium]